VVRVNYIRTMIEEMAWLPYVVATVVVGLPALAGIAMIVVGVRRRGQQRDLVSSGQQVSARVVDNQMESWSGGRTSFRPVVTYRTLAGQEVTTVLADLDGFRSHVVGTELVVFYDPAKPADATPVGGAGSRVAVTIVFGVIFLVFALVAFFVAGMIIDGFHAVGGGFEESEIFP
jgi:hypothetical protein